MQGMWTIANGTQTDCYDMGLHHQGKLLIESILMLSNIAGHSTLLPLLHTIPTAQLCAKRQVNAALRADYAVCCATKAAQPHHSVLACI